MIVVVGWWMCGSQECARGGGNCGNGGEVGNGGSDAEIDGGSGGGCGGVCGGGSGLVASSTPPTLQYCAAIVQLRWSTMNGSSVEKRKQVVIPLVHGKNNTDFTGLG